VNVLIFLCDYSGFLFFCVPVFLLS
jgi:hypothetical protein